MTEPETPCPHRRTRVIARDREPNSASASTAERSSRNPNRLSPFPSTNRFSTPDRRPGYDEMLPPHDEPPPAVQP
jgi:hypothetical protein